MVWTLTHVRTEGTGTWEDYGHKGRGEKEAGGRKRDMEDIQKLYIKTKVGSKLWTRTRHCARP